MPAVKKPVINAHFFGETREIVNGQVVKDTVVNTTYDGKVLHIDKQENDTHLETLLLRPTSKINLLDRLRYVYGQQTHKNKRKNKRTHKRKQSNKKKRRT